MLYLSVSTNPLLSTMTGTFLNGFIASNSGANCSPLQNIKIIRITTMGTILYYFQNKNTRTGGQTLVLVGAVNGLQWIITYHESHFIYNNIICSHWPFCVRQQGDTASAIFWRILILKIEVCGNFFQIFHIISRYGLGEWSFWCRKRWCNRNLAIGHGSESYAEFMLNISIVWGMILR